MRQPLVYFVVWRLPASFINIDQCKTRMDLGVLLTEILAQNGEVICVWTEPGGES